MTQERLEGGRRQYSFAYTTNPDHTSGSSVNTWKTKTVETLPDGSEHRVYSNGGNVMLVKILQKAGSADQWVDYWTYTAESRPLTHAHPSAVESVTEPSGGSSTLTVNLRTAAGKIELTDYYTEDADTGSSSSSDSGAVPGYVSTRSVQEGSGGTPQVLEKLTYDTQTVGGVSLHPIREKKMPVIL